jgi:hypothetical protein
MKALALLSCLLAGCSLSPRQKSRRGSDAGVHAVAAANVVVAPVAPPVAQLQPAAAPPPSAASVPLFRLAHAQASGEGSKLVGLGESLATQAETSIALDLPNGARVRLEPDTHIVVLEFEPSTLVLVSGAVFVELLPQGNQPGRSELRLVTALGTLIVSNTAEVWAAQRLWPATKRARASPPALAQAQLMVLRGVAELVRVDAAGLLHAEPLGAGETRPNAQPAKQPTTNFTLEDARRRSAEFVRQRRNPISMEVESGVLTRALAASAAQQRVGAELTDRMARLVAARAGGSVGPDAGAAARASDAEQVRAIMRELAGHAQQKHLLHQALLLAAEQYASAQLAACATLDSLRPQCPALATWNDSFSAALAGVRPRIVEQP